MKIFDYDDCNLIRIWRIWIYVFRLRLTYKVERKKGGGNDILFQFVSFGLIEAVSWIIFYLMELLSSISLSPPPPSLETKLRATINHRWIARLCLEWEYLLKFPRETTPTQKLRTKIEANWCVWCFQSEEYSP